MFFSFLCSSYRSCHLGGSCFALSLLAREITVYVSHLVHNFPVPRYAVPMDGVVGNQVSTGDVVYASNTQGKSDVPAVETPSDLYSVPHSNNTAQDSPAQTSGKAESNTSTYDSSGRSLLGKKPVEPELSHYKEASLLDLGANGDNYTRCVHRGPLLLRSLLALKRYLGMNEWLAC